MNRIKIAFVGFLLGLTGLWFLADALPLDAVGQRAFGVPFTQLSGVLAIGMMSFGMLLSIRPKWLEPTFDGLDKMYRLHKWLGVGGLGVGVVHWLTATGDGHGRPGAHAIAAAPAPAATAADATSWLAALHGPAHMVAEPALYALMALVAVALVKLIPYRIFAKTHILMAAVFALFAFHSVVLMKSAYWSQPIGWTVLAMSGVGLVSTVIAVLRRFGLKREAQAVVISTNYYPELRALETQMKVEPGWPGHEAGQFAFVTTDWREGPHPYTIATAWNPQTRIIGFIAKELGDHTAKLREHFVDGRPVRIEGPYGRFAFDDGKARQIWIGAGIGVTPFVAKMRERAQTPEPTQVDLFHVTSEVSQAALARLRADAAAANVRLHIVVSGVDGRLDAAGIREAAPDWREASLWFCGPSGFGGALRRDFLANGLLSSDFHQEMFEMR